MVQWVKYLLCKHGDETFRTHIKAKHGYERVEPPEAEARVWGVVTSQLNKFQV